MQVSFELEYDKGLPVRVRTTSVLCKQGFQK